MGLLNLIATLGVNLAPFRKGMKEAEQMSRDLANRSGGEFRKRSSISEEYARHTARRLKHEFMTIFGPIFAVETAKRGIDLMLQENREIREGARNLGLTNQEFQKLKLAAAEAGMPLEKYAATLGTTAQQMSDSLRKMKIAVPLSDEDLSKLQRVQDFWSQFKGRVIPETIHKMGQGIESHGMFGGLAGILAGLSSAAGASSVPGGINPPSGKSYATTEAINQANLGFAEKMAALMSQRIRNRYISFGPMAERYYLQDQVKRQQKALNQASLNYGLNPGNTDLLYQMEKAKADLAILKAQLTNAEQIPYAMAKVSRGALAGVGGFVGAVGSMPADEHIRIARDQLRVQQRIESNTAPHKVGARELITQAIQNSFGQF